MYHIYNSIRIANHIYFLVPQLNNLSKNKFPITHKKEFDNIQSGINTSHYKPERKHVVLTLEGRNYIKRLTWGMTLSGKMNELIC